MNLSDHQVVLDKENQNDIHRPKDDPFKDIQISPIQTLNSFLDSEQARSRGYLVSESDLSGDETFEGDECGILDSLAMEDKRLIRMTPSVITKPKIIEKKKRGRKLIMPW